MPPVGESAEAESASATGSGPLCSTWARERRLDPIGTAGCYRGYLLVEWPLPWPSDLSEDPLLAPVVELAREAGMRLQALAASPDEPGRHVICYRWPLAGGARLERAEVVVGPDEILDAAAGLLGRAPVEDGTVDVLVCTHGRRDRCCGSLGTVLAAQLQAEPAALGRHVRLWRTSHTGGHRFAPTALVLPQGTAWAFCDKAALVRIVARDGPLDDLLPRYRGCSGLSSPAVQALERAVFAELGWPLLDMARSGEGSPGGRVELLVESPAGEETLFEAVVRVAEVVPVPDCGRAIELSRKTEPQLVVEDLRRRRC